MQLSSSTQKHISCYARYDSKNLGFSAGDVLSLRLASLDNAKFEVGVERGGEKV